MGAHELLVNFTLAPQPAGTAGKELLPPNPARSSCCQGGKVLGVKASAGGGSPRGTGDPRGAAGTHSPTPAAGERLEQHQEQNGVKPLNKAI